MKEISGERDLTLSELVGEEIDGHPPAGEPVLGHSPVRARLLSQARKRPRQIKRGEIERWNGSGCANVPSGKHLTASSRSCLRIRVVYRISTVAEVGYVIPTSHRFA